MKKGYAYKSDDGIYFSVGKFKNYGKLARLSKIKVIKSRVKDDEYDKKDIKDFALWKFYTEKDGKNYWNVDIGKGRPGWHIECSVMSTSNLDENFDIHTGGIDLIFPHHENEIAQSEGAFGKKFVRYWVHNEYLMVEGKKMAKSLGNYFTLRDILKKGYKPRAIRYLLMSAHYKIPLNFTEEGLKAAETSIQRFKEFISKLKDVKSKKENLKIKKIIEETKKEFEKQMDDDLNISSALASIFDFMRKINSSDLGKKNAKEVLDFMKKIDKVLGILDFENEKILKEILDLVNKRERARKDKDFKDSDRIRRQIKKKGYYVDDTPDGPRVKKLD